MRVTVLLFARLREVSGEQTIECDVRDDATVADVWHDLTRRHPSLEPYAASVSAAVNDDFASKSTAVSDGDTIAFLPPVSGGAAGPRR